MCTREIRRILKPYPYGYTNVREIRKMLNSRVRTISRYDDVHVIVVVVPTRKVDSR